MPKNINQFLSTIPGKKSRDCITRPEFVNNGMKASLWRIGSPVTRFHSSEWEDPSLWAMGTVLSYNPTESPKLFTLAPRPGLEDKPENYFYWRTIPTAVDGRTRLEIIQEDKDPMQFGETRWGKKNWCWDS